VIFVDTGAWYAAFVPSDRDHGSANAWFEGNNERLATTDYVIDELLTLLKARGEYRRALRLGKKLFAEDICDLIWVTPEDIRQAWGLFSTYQDKEWSFTDCVSRSVMERSGITRVFAFDHHFRQFGTVTVVP
jgi:predicted nucleic acid-binding protein